MLLKKVCVLITIGIAVAGLAVLISGTSCSRQPGAKIIIKGSTTVLPIAQKAAEAFMKNNPKVAIAIDGSGSGNGIKALIDGTCDIANSSRQMKPDELKKAAAKGIKARKVVVGIDMICPVVHPSNPVKNITKEQLKRIYDGSITNWKEIDGNDQTIVVVSRDTSSGTYEAWHDKVMDKTDVRKDALLQASNGAIVTTIAGNPKAIGYIGFGYISDRVKLVQVNGINATLENGKSGRFPLSRHLYMYVNEEKISDHAKGFIAFILGREGQRLVSEAGYISLK